MGIKVEGTEENIQIVSRKMKIDLKIDYIKHFSPE